MTASPRSRVPDRPSLDGLENTWVRRWEKDGIYRFDRAAARDRVYSIDTPPADVQRHAARRKRVLLHAHRVIARFQRMRGKAVFYPMGWDDNGLPTERRVQAHFGVRCNPALPYEPSASLPQHPAADRRPVAISRRASSTCAAG